MRIEAQGSELRVKGFGFGVRCLVFGVWRAGLKPKPITVTAGVE